MMASFSVSRRDVSTKNVRRAYSIASSPRFPSTEQSTHPASLGRVKRQSPLTRTQFDQNCHCERSVAIWLGPGPSLCQRDCRVASLLAMTGLRKLDTHEAVAHRPIQRRIAGWYNRNSYIGFDTQAPRMRRLAALSAAGRYAFGQRTLRVDIKSCIQSTIREVFPCPSRIMTSLSSAAAWPA